MKVNPNYLEIKNNKQNYSLIKSIFIFIKNFFLHKKITLSSVDSLEKVRLYLDQVCNRYREEYGYNSINAFMSENAANHLIRIHRVLSFTQAGNLLLIGTAGNHLTSLIKLAFYLADIQHLSVDCSKTSLFSDSMRSAVRTAGAENKCVGLVLTVIKML